MQNLYCVRVSLYLDGFGLSDEVTERFGIREICSVEDPVLSGHVFYVNGEKVSSCEAVASSVLAVSKSRRQF